MTPGPEYPLRGSTEKIWSAFPAAPVAVAWGRGPQDKAHVLKFWHL